MKHFKPITDDEIREYLELQNRKGRGPSVEQLATLVVMFMVCQEVVFHLPSIGLQPAFPVRAGSNGGRRGHFAGTFSPKQTRRAGWGGCASRGDSCGAEEGGRSASGVGAGFGGGLAIRRGWRDRGEPADFGGCSGTFEARN